MYGLPENVIHCKKCNLSNQQPTSTNEYFHNKDTKQVTVKFSDAGICKACLYTEKKWGTEIDWDEREKELADLCDQHRKTDGSYDCIVGGSGGKDSVFQSWVLKYRYKMHPLTVTWAPHLYTDIGWKNFQNWMHKGGFDNYLFTPNGHIHRCLTKNATINLLHPFQPFIMGQKTLAAKIAIKYNVKLVMYGELPAEYGRNMSHTTKGFNTKKEELTQEGYQLDPLNGRDPRDIFLGGKQYGEYLDEGFEKADLMAYLPTSVEDIYKQNISKYFLGYFLRWTPQENFYFATEKTGFEVNPVRTEGTYQKYGSLDDKLDGFFYYTRYIKFGVGRAMMDSAQEIRNGYIDRDEGLRLIKKYDGEYPKRYEQEFLDYVSLGRDQFDEICDRHRPEHLWTKNQSQWKLRQPVWEQV